jgi:hypothetical protein
MKLKEAKERLIAELNKRTWLERVDSNVEVESITYEADTDTVHIRERWVGSGDQGSASS